MCNKLHIFIFILIGIFSKSNGQNFSNMSGPKVERIEEIPPTELGEGPHWDAETQSLYFVDIFGKSIHKYVPATKKHTKAVIGKHVSIIIPVQGEKDKFVISIERELAVITWDGESEKVSNIEKIAEVDTDPDTLGNRFNDGKCDRSGRLWAGTMGAEPENGHVTPNKGSLYSLNNKKPVVHLKKLGISNGLAWSLNSKKMYYIDTFNGAVDELKFDIEKGTIEDRKPIFTLSKHNIEGGLDGMTVDKDGNLWIAIFNGNRVIKIDPTKPESLMASISIPAKQVTSVSFGGPNLQDLYVTTAKFTIDGHELLAPDHGSTYKITNLNTWGEPGVSVVL